MTAARGGSRGLSRYADDFAGTSGNDLFFALADKKYLRSETKEYVPQLIAAALVAKEPARYGLHIVPLSPYAYDTVRVPASTPLAAIAKASGTTTGVLNDLNPHVLRGVTPPRDSFTVRVPVGTLSGFDSGFRALPVQRATGLHPAHGAQNETYPALSRRSSVCARAQDLQSQGEGLEEWPLACRDGDISPQPGGGYGGVRCAGSLDQALRQWAAHSYRKAGVNRWAESPSIITRPWPRSCG